MKLTVIGRSGACPNPGEACSGYLVESENVQLLLDCGTGVVSRLRRMVDFRKVSAIVISHMHFDHFADLIPYTYGLKLGVPLEDGYRPSLFLPPGGHQILGKVVEQWQDLSRLIDTAFEVHEFSPDTDYRFGPLQVRFVATKHYVPCWGIVVAEGDKLLVYSADAGPSDALRELAANANLLLCEASLEVRTGSQTEYGHLTAREAGEVAAAASAERLILTHFWDHFDRQRMLVEARDAFPGPVDLAEELHGYTV